MKRLFLIVAIILFFPITANSKVTDNTAAVLRTLDSWNQGWAERNATLAAQDYAEHADWTNAFGDRFQGRDALTKGLEFIFGLDFVMAGDSGISEYSDVTFLSPDVALLRSKLVRKGQKTRSGEPMADRHINHLRVLQRNNGVWQIVSHLISQAKVKR